MIKEPKLNKEKIMKTFHLKCHSPNINFNNWKIVDVECDLSDKETTRIQFINGLNHIIAHWCQVHHSTGHLEFDIWANKETLTLLQFDAGCSIVPPCGHTCYFRVPLVEAENDIFTIAQHASTVGELKANAETTIAASKAADVDRMVDMLAPTIVSSRKDLPKNAQQGEVCCVQDSGHMVMWHRGSWIKIGPSKHPLSFPKNTIFSRIRAIVISTKRYRDRPMELFDAINRGLDSAHDVDQLKTVGYYAACPDDENRYTIAASFCVPADYAKFRKSTGMRLLWNSVNGNCTHIEDDNLIRNDWAFASYLQSKDFIYIFGRSLAEQEWRFTQRCNRYFKSEEMAADGAK